VSVELAIKTASIAGSAECLRLISDSRAVSPRQPFRRLAVDIDDCVQPCLGMGGDVGSMDRTDAPGTELAEADHSIMPRVTQILEQRAGSRRADAWKLRRSPHVQE
jgi:hypothetical protein